MRFTAAVWLTILCLAFGAEASDFGASLKAHQDSTYREFEKRLPKRDYLETLSVDPRQAAFFDVVSKKLQMTKPELDIYGKKGFVSIDHGQRYSFGSAYYAIYTRDLPVLVTTDSILHAMHKSFDATLMDIERTYFLPEIQAILGAMHAELEALAGMDENKGLMTSFKDIDLYLTVARNLVKGGGAVQGDMSSQRKDDWHGKLIVTSTLGMDEPALEILGNVRDLKINTPLEVYGEKRKVDFSQFVPRGHYTKSTALKRYFRTLMWLGRVDCGFNVIKPDGASSVKTKPIRGCRNAAIVCRLLTGSDTFTRLETMSHMIDLLVGQADNVSQALMKEALEAVKVDRISVLAEEANVKKLQDYLRSSGKAAQAIRSQLVYRENPDEQAALPSVCQLFGQRFIPDSFILSQLVYDSITYKGSPVMRMMPEGLDVMAALGNDMAGRMLKTSMTTYPYAANMMACEDYVKSIPTSVWEETVYNHWLNILRQLDVDKSSERHFPQVMKTRTWRLKQLQTQLASWSQLRHDTILYAKQSYTCGYKCEYPKGYVEPYPEVYRKIGKLAEAMASCLSSAKVPARLTSTYAYYVKFWKRFAGIQARLAQLAEKELQAEPFTADDERFIKKTIDRRGGGSGEPTYDGWYAELFLRRDDSFLWEPEIVDVHTNPDNNGISECLEVGTGDVNFMIVAIDNGDDLTAYVGPAFTYYEFVQNLNGDNKRLTDETWGKRLRAGKAPARPDWTKSFQAPVAKRTLKGARKR